MQSTQLVTQGIENKKTFELNEEEINKLRDEVGKYTTEADLVGAPCESLHFMSHSRAAVQYQGQRGWLPGTCIPRLACLCLPLQRRVTAQNIKRLKDIGSYRGRRHIMVRA